MIITFEGSVSKQDEMIVFKGMQIVTFLREDTIYLGAARDGKYRTINFSDKEAARKCFKQIDVALSYDKALHPEMFL